LIVSIGRLGDLIGRRRLLLAGLCVFMAASLLCGMATELWILIVARSLQGLGAAAMMALTLAFVAEAIPKDQIGRAMGTLGMMSSIGTALGPSLGGLLIAGLGWQAIFLVNLPLGLLALALAWHALPADPPAARENGRRFDVPGTLVLALTLGAYALAMTLGRGNFGLRNGLLLLAVAIGVGVFVLVERRAPAPLIPLAMFANRSLSAAFVMNTLIMTVVMATLVVGPFYLSGGLGLDTAMVGLVMSAGPIAAALAGVPAGRAVDRFGAQRMSLTGLTGMATGCLALSVIPVSFGIPGYLIPLVVITSSYALFQAANNTSVMSGIRADQRGVVSGLLNLSRNLGLITGASVMGALFAFGSGATGIGTLAAASSGMLLCFGAGTAMILIALAIALGQQAASRRAPLEAP